MLFLDWIKDQLYKYAPHRCISFEDFRRLYTDRHAHTHTYDVLHDREPKFHAGQKTEDKS